MLRTTLAAATCGLALLAPTTFAASSSAVQPVDRAGSSITGAWKGQVLGDAGSGGAYPAKVTVSKKKGKLAGKVVYPGQCKGVWKSTGKKGGWTTFREIITSGPCVSPVQVKVKRSGSTLKVVWREPISGDQGSMVATKA
jgi:hypothetical protein